MHVRAVASPSVHDMRDAMVPPCLNVVCVMHGGFTVPKWLLRIPASGRLYLTLNDPEDHEYADVPPGCILTTNPQPLGFAENVNAALRKVFDDDGQSLACLVNFDLELEAGALGALVSVMAADERLGAVAARLYARDGSPVFSAGTRPTPLREFLRAAGLRSGPLFDLQRAVIRHTRGWTARNAVPDEGARVLGPGEYIPWTCLVVREAAWSAVGGLDERFPMYGEDIDWSFRCHQSDWKLGLADCGRIVHHERATRSPRTDVLYEYSHLELHRKWGWDTNLRWHRRGLEVRHRWPLEALTPALDWALLTSLEQARSEG